MRRGKLTTNGVTLSYRTTGAGQDVVLIHGLATNHAFWSLNVLLSLAREFRVTVFDIRGHGNSSMPEKGYTHAEMVKDLQALLEHLEINRAHIIGHSLGGVIALHFATSHPERLLSLTVADSRVRVFQPTNYIKDWPNGRTALEKLKKMGLNVPADEAEAGVWLLEQIASPEWQKARHKLAGSSLGVPFGGWNGGQKTAEQWLKLLGTTSLRNDLAKPAGLTKERISAIRVPCLVMYGEHSSTLNSFEGLRDLLPCCKIVLVPDAGHFFPLTKSEVFVGQVKQFLNEVEVKN